MVLTPFERNIEIWRQLWHVVEKSDLIVQILDARNPLLFRNEDLELYVNEINLKNQKLFESVASNDSPSLKRNLLLLNKADFLTLKQREMWCQYFNKEKIHIVFWSAVDLDDDRLSNVSNAKIEEESEPNDTDTNIEVKTAGIETDVHSSDSEDEFDSTNSNDDDSEYETVDDEEDEKCYQVDSNLKCSDSKFTGENSAKVLTRAELLEYFKEMKKAMHNRKELFTIGKVSL